ncbi:regulation of response to stimulus [Phytophthora ramorum]
MLGGIFHKRKKSQELRSPSLQDLKKFRDAYAKYAELRQVETPPCFEKSIYKAIAGQKELHSVEFRQEDITDPQMIALVEALLEMPIISSLDLRDNRITDDGAKALLEVLRLQIIAAKTPPTVDPRTRQPLYPPLPEYTRYVTNVNLKGNEVSTSVLQEISHYIDVLRREDKRLEIRAALKRIDRNSDGSIDEEEFKGVLKLLTAATPTKKEIRAFMQQHTLSTDSTQNVTNLENVLLAKCATSPSRHSACPPWEALVQERHAILGAPRMAPTMMSTLPETPSSSSSKAPHSRPSLPSSGSGLTTGGVSPFLHSNSATDVSPLATPLSQIAPVAPLEMMNVMAKPPPVPSVVSVPAAPQQSQYATKISESKSAAIPPEPSATFTKPPAIPMLPLASVTQPFVSPSPRSARSSGDDEGQRHLSLTREGGPSSIISAPSSPHGSDTSDNMSVGSSAFGSVSQRVMEDHEHANGTERKLPAAPTATTNLDSPRWQSEHFSGEGDEGTSIGGLSSARNEVDELSSDDAEDDARSGSSQKPPKSLVTSGSSANELSDSKSMSSVSRREGSFQGNETSREIPARSEYSSAVHDEKRSLPGSVVSTPRFDDLSSLVYREAEEGSRSAFSGNAEKTDLPSDQPEEDEEVEEQIDSLVVDITKDGKERFVLKLTHSEFRRGLAVKDFPAELPFRTLVALLLPENGLSDLALFSDCRFPFVLVLDLSRNKLSKLADDDLTAFPRLEVLNLADNQLKTISGLTKMFKLRALGIGHNSIRTVKNVEHLAQLEILQLSNNQIVTVHALRQLSLNKVLAHLDLDGNPVVETDERQKRKNIVHVRNLLPALQSLGSISCAGLKDKQKASSDANPGKCMFESDLMPDYKSLWVSTACDELHIVQDATSHSSHRSQHEDDDEWDTRDEDGDADRPKKPLTREQQRQKDELRSRALGFRSRGKAIPSPPKMKMSVYSFGPAQPAPVKKKKKPALVDPSVVREQQRRASELSAPKHGPVDKNLMQQAQKRKSRVDFHGAMTVAERLQLARDMTQRRPTASVGLSARSRSILAKADSRKRASSAASMIVREEEIVPEGNSMPASRSPSPQRPSPMKDAMVFRIDPVNTPRSPKGALTFRVDPYPGGHPSASKPNGSKEAEFLHDLAVSDFLNHAEEEFSTALTALNVLLSMSEKEQGDRKKLADYRASLDALDILNEYESHELFTKAQGHPEHELQAQCTEWFTKLGVVKKCMRQLLEKLEVHAPGSGVIRAYCRCIRSNELRGIIITMLETQEDVISQESTTSVGEVEPTKEDGSHAKEQEPPQPTAIDRFDEMSNQADSGVGSVFAEPASLTIHEAHRISQTIGSGVDDSKVPHGHASGDNDLDFLLESNDSVFDVEETGKEEEDTPTVHAVVDTSVVELQNEAVVSDPVLFVVTTDITMDIQMNVPGLVGSNHNADDTQWTGDVVEDNHNGMVASGSVEDEGVSEVYCETGEPVEVYDSETLGRTASDEVEDEATNISTPADAAAIHDEDYDWLADSSELEAENTEADSFKQEMDAVSEDETNGEAGQEEQAEASQAYDWSNIEAPIEEGAEASEEVFDGETYENEEPNDTVEEQGDYNGDEEVATEETEVADSQFDLREGVDADDEEAETFGDWEKGFDPNSNHYFWFNHSTGDSSWTPPEGWPYEVDEPFSTEEGVDTGEEQQEREYEASAAEGQEYDEPATEGQDYEADGQYYDEGATEGQYYDESAVEEGTAEGQYYEEGAVEDRYYEEGAAEGESYNEGATEDQEYEEASAEGQEFEESEAEEQQYEATTEGQWYDETATENQEYATEDQTSEVAEDEEHQVEQAGEESPRRSEVSDFEFDDSDLPGF